MKPTLVTHTTLFRNRTDAGQQLAAVLQTLRGRPNVIVLGLPRGGVPVAREVSAALHLPLDVLNVRKLGAPRNEELAIGAVASGGVVHLDDYLMSGLRIPQSWISYVVPKARLEIERRERLYRKGRSFPSLLGKTVILVDDGIATGSTMKAAITAVRQLGCYRVIVAAPIASASACDELHTVADEVITLHRREDFHALSQWYDEFEQVSDQEVISTLHEYLFSSSIAS